MRLDNIVISYNQEKNFYKKKETINLDKATTYRAKRLKKSNLFKPPKRFAWYLKPVAWLLSAEALRAKITKINMKGLKPPYILLCNHQSFTDFKVATKAVFPHRYNNVVAIDGFIGREGIMRKVGCFCKRKFINDIGLVINIRNSVRKYGDICCIYPEARYAFIGASGLIPKAIGKLIKAIGIPAVILNMSGNFIDSPYWNRGSRKVPLRARMEQIVNAEEAAALPVEEINRRIAEGLRHDDYRYQQDNNIRIKSKTNVEGMHFVLYQCPACKASFSMSSKGTLLACSKCGAEYTLTEYGKFEKNGGTAEFPHPPQWFAWQRKNVRREIESPDYFWRDECVVWTLKDSNGFKNLDGVFAFTHSRRGFSLSGVFDGEEKSLEWNTEQLYSVHDEIGDAVGQAVSLSTQDQTYYIFPQNRPLEIVKLRVAAEETHKFVMGVDALAIETSELG